VVDVGDAAPGLAGGPELLPLAVLPVVLVGADALQLSVVVEQNPGALARVVAQGAHRLGRAAPAEVHPQPFAPAAGERPGPLEVTVGEVRPPVAVARAAPVRALGGELAVLEPGAERALGAAGDVGRFHLLAPLVVVARPQAVLLPLLVAPLLGGLAVGKERFPRAGAVHDRGDPVDGAVGPAELVGPVGDAAQ